MEHRTERDSMGEVLVPADAYYGAQTQRAVLNFPISGIRFSRRFLWALGLIKRCCAEANAELGLLPADAARSIAAAAAEVEAGALDAHFPLDIFQTGSGTSTNMNANEVIASRANEQLGGPRGGVHPVHPNDHVNMGQSSNDVIPSAIHVAAAAALHQGLLPALDGLYQALAQKAQEFDPVLKSGRTHLMDATPVRLGQEFGGYAEQVRQGMRRVQQARDALLPLALGGTATGTGINRPLELPQRVIARIAAETGLPFVEAPDHFAAQGSMDALPEASGLLKATAVGLMKIANDIRLLASGPRTGLAEITLPDLAPGSSIMPGKVNPVMSEMLTQVCCQVVGNDAAISLGGAGGVLELNTYMPLMAHNLLQSIELLTNAAATFTARCVVGIQANVERCRESVESNLAICTALAPVIGYDTAAAISKEAFRSGRTVRAVAREMGVLPEEELERLLDARAMTYPGAEGASAGA